MMSDTFKALEVSCPNCGEVKHINVPVSILTQKKFGTVKIQVPINAVCPEHQFIVFVDTKGIVRGYEKIDIHMAIGVTDTKEEPEASLNLRNLIGLFGVYGIFNLIHAKIFNYRVYILPDNDFEFSEDTLNTVGDLILPKNFAGSKTIHVLDNLDISKLKIKDKDTLVMDTRQHIFQTPWTTKLKFEEGIVKRALGIIDETEQLKLLRQDVERLVNEASQVTSILEGVNEIYEDELVERLSKENNIKKPNDYRLILIKEFIRRNISDKLVSKIKNRVGEFLSIL
ncbi:MAG: hypothetical protein ACXABO_03650 [Promethearchaeota archaeon]|jgi:hypothetical protein